MVERRQVLKGGLLGLIAAAAGGGSALGPVLSAPEHLSHTESEWKKLLNRDQFQVLRKAGTERPFSSELLHEAHQGTYACAGCALPLFSSETKFDSGTGWPSFWAPLDNAIKTETDTSLGMTRNAVSCVRCEGHLGHVFDDGPKPTGLRYCMNGVALKFIPRVV